MDNAHDIYGVVTSPDKPAGRGQKMLSSPIKLFAEKNNIPVLPIIKVKDPSAIEELKKLKADCFVVVSYGGLLPNEIIEMTPYGCVNLHSSLLPQYRGASPVVHALLNGDREIGVTTMKITEELDAGDIFLQESIFLTGNENAEEINRTLAMIGGNLMATTLQGLKDNRIMPRPQDSSKSTYAPKLKKENGWIDWKKSAVQINNQVRAFYIWPGSRTRINQKEITLLRTKIAKNATPMNVNPGEILRTDNEKSIHVATGDGVLEIEELKLEGKCAMHVRDFLNGHPLKAGDVFRS